MWHTRRYNLKSNAEPFISYVCPSCVCIEFVTFKYSLQNESCVRAGHTERGTVRDICNLKTCSLQPAGQTYVFGMCSFIISPEISAILRCLRRICLSHGATIRKIAGLIPNGFTGEILPSAKWPSNRNKHQKYFLGKGGRCAGLTILTH
jgi:hypothetical protein